MVQHQLDTKRWWRDKQKKVTGGQRFRHRSSRLQKKSMSNCVAQWKIIGTKGSSADREIEQKIVKSEAQYKTKK
jgi:hypothetical protein